MLTRLTYSSMITAGHGHADFLEIVDFAQRSNALGDIGGIIAFDGFQFIQILEGEDAVVSALFARISLDRRNEGVVEIRHQDIAVRHFNDWTMRRMPLVNVLMLSSTLDDDTAGNRGVSDKATRIAVRLQLTLAQMAMACAITLANRSMLNLPASGPQSARRS